MSNIFFPKTERDTLSSERHLRAWRDYEEPLVDTSSAGIVPAFGRPGTQFDGSGSGGGSGSGSEDGPVCDITSYNGGAV